VQEGIVGLIIARNKFKPSKGARFSTYANYWIRAKILRLLDRYSSTIHVTFSASATYSKLVKKYGTIGDIIEDLLDKIQLDYNKGRISGRDYRKFIDILHAKSPDNYNHISIDDALDSANTEHSRALDSDSRSLGMDILKHLEQVNNAEDLLCQRALIRRLIDALEPDERKLVIMYYGLDGKDSHTYNELSKVFKCSKQRVHQWHKRITAKLRANLKDICLKDRVDLKEMVSNN
jgi:RNA polymerase primary sigma factor